MPSSWRTRHREPTKLRRAERRGTHYLLGPVLPPAPQPRMQHGTTLIATISLAFAAALLLGILVARIGLPPIVGYLLAGIAIGAVHPGLGAENGVASQASEMGVILLMFEIGRASCRERV